MTPQNKNEELEKERMYEDARIVYQALLKDIQFYKNQQWLTTYYVFGIFIFLFTVLSQLSKMDFYYLLLVTVMVISVVVMLGGIWLLFIYEEELKRSRTKKDETIKLLSDEMKNILSSENKKINYDIQSEQKNNQTILNILVTVMIGGEIFVFLFAWFKLFTT